MAEPGALRGEAEGVHGGAPRRHRGRQEGEGGADAEALGAGQDPEAGEGRGPEAPVHHRAALPLQLRAAAHEHHLPRQVPGRLPGGRLLPHQGLAGGDRHAPGLEAEVVRRDVHEHGREGAARPRAGLPAPRRRERGRRVREEAPQRRGVQDDICRLHRLQVRDPQGLRARDQGAARLQARVHHAHGRRPAHRPERGARGWHRDAGAREGAPPHRDGRRGSGVDPRDHVERGLQEHQAGGLRRRGAGEAAGVPRPRHHGEVPGAAAQAARRGHGEGRSPPRGRLREAVARAEGADHPLGEEVPGRLHPDVRRRRQRRGCTQGGGRGPGLAQRLRQRQRG
mmetsp:Transcript_14786/g.44424  ORF Transcript_14786/g.44424 Transcript_14786/m.44424 type:complete len:339 (-) Transcript_14786:1524-2540(-)